MPTASQTGIANKPFPYDRAPRWRLDRMVKLARQINFTIVSGFGPKEILKRLSHPYRFQATDCVPDCDRYSSGVTATVCGAPKEAIKDSKKRALLKAFKKW